MDALPFIVRVLGQHRRDHSGIERALKSVLLSDGGEDALARGRQFDTSARRKMYELLIASGTASQRRLLNAALKDSDAVIRARAIRSAATDPDFEDRAAILERFLRDDRVPAVRRLALTVLSEHMPERIAGVFPQVRSLSDAKARGNLLRVFLEAPKWEAPMFLLDAVTDPDDGVRTLAIRLVDRWIEGFNRSQTQPTAKQLQRIGALLDAVASRMPEETAKMVRFSIKPP